MRVHVLVCLSMLVGVYECEQMGVVEIKSTSVLAGADGRLHDRSITASSPYPW